MLAAAGGGGAAVAFTVATLATAQASRMISPISVVAGVSLSGLLITAPLAAARGGMSHAPADVWVWLGIGGSCYVIGLVVGYRAFGAGAAALVAPIMSTEGAIAALLAILLGERVSVATLVFAACIAIGVILATMAPKAGTELYSPNARRAAVLAIIAALVFGVSLFATGRAASEAPAMWVVLAAPLVGVAIVAVPLIAMRKTEFTPGAIPLVIAGGAAEVLGILSYSAGARHNVAVAAVLCTQFATLTVVCARIFFGERLSRMQAVGVAVVLLAVSAFAVVS